jgi:2-polyprenyl-6-methoxyphenol hydroxylase-like FAD-dependent oxidoreductase
MRIVVAGGGLVGLTLTRLLAARGLDAVAIERMQPGQYVRRGFMLGHHGFDALDQLGLLADVRARGRAIGLQPDGREAAIAVEVGDLLGALADGADVRYGHSVTGLLREGDRVRGVQVEGPDGPGEITADLVVACDGLMSRVRQMAGIRADFAPLAEGKIEWMSPVPCEQSFAMAYLSNGAHIGMLSWPEGSFGWRTMDRPGRDAALAPDLEDFIQAWERLLPESAAGVRALTSVDELLYTEPALLSCPTWWVPGVVVVGDAAHFFGPETGASAGVGLADALALAEAVRANPQDVDAACATYEQWRGPAIRPVEAMDPSRGRLEGALIAEPAPGERWPPPG